MFKTSNGVYGYKIPHWGQEKNPYGRLCEKKISVEFSKQK
jgi:hypothetical protein